MLAALASNLRDRSPRPSPAVPAPAQPAAAALPRPFHIEVAEGGERLFAQPFEAGAFVVGSSPTADIIIPDLDEPEIASVKLETVGSACLVTLVALAPGVTARGRALAVGKPVLFPERARFKIAGAYDFDIAFTPPKRPIVVERSSLPALLVGGGLLLAALAAAAGSGPAEVPAPEAPVVLASLDAAAPAPVGPGPAERLAEAESRLRSAFAAANLSPQLRVSAVGGRLLVEGDATPDERARALDLIAAQRARGETPVELALASDARDAAFIAAVVTQPETFIIGSDGRRYAPGQALPDGRRILAIDEEAVALERDGVRERILYAR